MKKTLREISEEAEQAKLEMNRVLDDARDKLIHAAAEFEKEGKKHEREAWITFALELVALVFGKERAETLRRLVDAGREATGL